MFWSGKLDFSNSIGLVTEGCIAIKRKIRIKAQDEATLNLVITVSKDEKEVQSNLEYYRVEENIKQEFNITRARAEEEARYLNVTKTDFENLNAILPYIIHQNPMRSMYMNELNEKEYKQSDFWKYGISGDIPIILVKVQYINDVYVVREILKIHEILRAKGIKLDICILDYEKNVYERYVKDQIIQEILNMQIGYLQNVSGGIFLLNANEIEDEDLFKFKANIIINASNGNVLESIKEMEDKYFRQIKSIGVTGKMEADNREYEVIKPNIDIENLKFYNGFGGFSDDGKEYIIRQNRDLKLPTIWSNILANKNFGTIITNNMGGFTYSKNSRLNRITSWANTPANDVPSEIVYLRDLDSKEAWTLNANVMEDEEDYYMIYGFGYVKEFHASKGIIQETEVFVPINDNVKINIIKLKNTLSEKRRLKLVYYIKPVLGEDETKTTGNINLEFDKDKNILFAKNIYGETLSKNVFVSSSEEIKSYTGNKLSFIGSGSLAKPDAIFGTGLSMENALGVPSCIAVEMEIELEAYEDKKLVLMLGEEEEKEAVINVVNKYKDLVEVEQSLRETRDYWGSLLRRVQVKTNNEEIDFMLNRLGNVSDNCM